MAEQDRSSIEAFPPEDYESDEEDLWCGVCQKSFSGPIPFLQHEKGAGHRKALLRAEHNDAASECAICQKEVPVDAWESHLKGKPHKKAEAALRLLKQLKKGNISKEALKSNKVLKTASNDGNSSQEEDEISEQELLTKVFECNECCKAFTGVEPYYLHLLSPAHEKVLKQQQQLLELAEAHSQYLKLHEDGTLVCFVCKAAFSGPESAKAHLKGRGHRRKEELLRWRRERRAQSKEERQPDAEANSGDESTNTQIEGDEVKDNSSETKFNDVWV